MPGPSQRILKIADLIRHNLALILKKHISDPRLLDVVLTSVDLAPDLSQAKIYFTLIKSEDAKMVARVLAKASGRFRSLLAESATLRSTPRLIFIYDDAIIRAERIDHLLQQVESDKSNDQDE